MNTHKTLRELASHGLTTLIALVYAGGHAVIRHQYCPCVESSRTAPHPQVRAMATAEYAIVTLAAVGFAGLLVLILRSPEVRGFLLSIIRTALNTGP